MSNIHLERELEQTQTALEQMKKSALMGGHKPQGPSQAWVYHPEEAPGGTLILLADMEKWLNKPGWVDSPDKFPNAGEKLSLHAENATATTEQIVDQAVKEELRKQASGEVEVVADEDPEPEPKPKTKRKTTKRKSK